MSDIYNDNFRRMLPIIKKYLNAAGWRNFIVALQCDRSKKWPRLCHLIAVIPRVVDEIRITAADITRITIFNNRKNRKDKAATVKYDLGKFTKLRHIELIGDLIDYDSIIESCKRRKKIKSLTIINDRSIRNDLNKLFAAFPHLREFYLYNTKATCRDAAKELTARGISYAILFTSKRDDHIIIKNGSLFEYSKLYVKRSSEEIIYSNETMKLKHKMRTYHNREYTFSCKKNEKIIKHKIKESNKTLANTKDLIEITDRDDMIDMYNQGCRDFIIHSPGKKISVYYLHEAGELSLCRFGQRVQYCYNSSLSFCGEGVDENIWPNLTELYLEHVLFTLPLIAPKLNKLTLNYSNIICENDIYQPNMSVKHLCLYNCGFSDPDEIFKYMPQLEKLELKYCMSFEFKSIKDFPHLRKVKVGQNVSMRDIHELPPSVRVSFLHRDFECDEYLDIIKRPQFKYAAILPDINKYKPIAGYSALNLLGCIITNIGKRFN